VDAFAQIVRGENVPLFRRWSSRKIIAVENLVLSERPGRDQLERSVSLRLCEVVRKRHPTARITPTRRLLEFPTYDELLTRELQSV